MRRAVIVLILASLIFLTTGCWDVQDMRNRTFVTAIGIDASLDPESKYKITFEIARPAGIRPDSNTPGRVIQTLEAESINAAIEQLQTRVGRHITLAHLTLIMVGEEKARRLDFRDIADYFSRHPEVQKRIWVMFVQQGEAMDVLHTQPLFETYLSAELVRKAELQPQPSVVRRNPFIELLLDLRSTDGKGLASRILASEEGNLNMRDGAAVFSDWKLAGWLSSSEAQAANWLVGRAINATVDSIVDNSTYTYIANKKDVRIIPDTQNNNIQFTVKLRTDGTVIQQQGNRLDLARPDSIARLENLFAQTIKTQVEDAINKAQNEFGTDYLGFGQALNRRYPNVYRNVNWDQTFPRTSIRVEVESHVTRTGLSP